MFTRRSDSHYQTIARFFRLQYSSETAKHFGCCKHAGFQHIGQGSLFR